MEQSICMNCGAPLARGAIHCHSCGFVGEKADTKQQKILSPAFELLRESQFDKAKKAFEAILKKDPKNVSAYWGHLRARYRITYFLCANGTSVPQCPTRSGLNLKKDSDYRKATQYASNKQKVFLREQTKAIKTSYSEGSRAKNLSSKFSAENVDTGSGFSMPSRKENTPEMRRKRRTRIVLSAVIALLLVLVLLFFTGLIPIYAANGLLLRSNGNFTFRVSDMGQCADSAVTIPSKCLGMPVTSIGNYTFSHCGNLTDITFEGTKAQWEAVSLGTDWYYCTGKYTVTCTDGTISE